MVDMVFVHTQAYIQTIHAVTHVKYNVYLYVCVKLYACVYIYMYIRVLTSVREHIHTYIHTLKMYMCISACIYI